MLGADGVGGRVVAAAADAAGDLATTTATEDLIKELASLPSTFAAIAGRRVGFVPLSSAPRLAVGYIVRAVRRNEILETFINVNGAQVGRQSVKLVGGLIESGA